MLTSLSEFKFFQSFRMPIEEADQVRFLVESDDGLDDYKYIEDAKLVDVSSSGLGFSCSKQLSVGDDLRITIQFKKLFIDIEGTVVRSFSENVESDKIIYGVEIEETKDMSRFLQKFILSLHPERLRECMVQLSLTDRYSRSSEGIEMFSLLISVFRDLTKFGEKEEFLNAMLEEVTRILDAQRASVFLINPENNKLQAIAALGMEKEKLKFDYRQGIAGSVFTTGVSLNIDTERDETRFSDSIDVMSGFTTKSIICNPIYNREDKTIGVIEVLNKRGGQRFTEEDEKVMKVLSLVFSSIFHTFNPMSEKSQIRRFSTPFDREFAIIGKSTPINSLRRSIVKLKDVDTPLLVHGEYGVGKTLYGQVVHFEGKRGLKEFKTVDCKNMSEQFFQETFLGENCVFETVKGGTILLRNIECLSYNHQMKVFELLQKGFLEGSTISFDFRLISTTNVDINEMVKEGKFNEDFFEFISKGFISIPPLRERNEDIEGLVNYFLKMECRKQGLLLKAFSPKLLEDFTNYDWPENILELKTYVERAVTLNPRNHIINEINDLTIPKLNKSIKGLRIFDDIPFASSSELCLKDRVSLIERKIIEMEIKRVKGNKSKAAKEMGISREALRKKLIHSDEVLERVTGTDGQKKAA